MLLIEQTTVPALALPVQEFTEHLRLGTGFADDGVQTEVLQGFLRAALASIETRTGKALLERAFLWQISGWRGLAEQALPMAPVTAISKLATLDRAGIETVIDPARYVLKRDNQRPKILATGACLPTIPLGGCAELVFNAGYGTDWADMPADLAQAVFLLAAHHYEHRAEVAARTGEMPHGVAALIAPYRTVRMFGAAT
jgi:uncharacterized phiE125 gp8 family phage protein